MKVDVKLKSIAPDLWVMSFPLKMLGADLQRNVTLMRLPSRKVIIHSTAPFGAIDIETIDRIGEPVWLLDVLLRHDTFSAEGSDAFPAAKYLVPDGFEAHGVATRPLLPPPPEWEGEVMVAPVNGVPSYGEIAVFHRASRTLVVGDLLFNFRNKRPFWTKLLMKLGCVNGKFNPGVSRPFKNAIEDEAAFAASLRGILEWDFDRIIVGHGDPIAKGGREKLRAAFKAVGIAGL